MLRNSLLDVKGMLTKAVLPPPFRFPYHGVPYGFNWELYEK